jgi:hypothetical protein
MFSAMPVSDQRDAVDARESPDLSITDGEINFFWSFIQGSVMIPETRNALLRAYGFCERHAWVHLSVEMSFRKRHFLGPVILYHALIEKSVQEVQTRQHVSLRPPMRRLRPTGSCFLCALNINNAGAGASSRARLDRGRDSNRLRDFATGLAPLWRPNVCAVCSNEPRNIVGASRCRRHLLTDLKLQKPVDLSCQQGMLQELSRRLARYEKSFVAGADEPTDQDRASLISAIGWCSGWRPLLALLSKAVPVANQSG